jgi:hypothetical protein
MKRPPTAVGGISDFSGKPSLTSFYQALKVTRCSIAFLTMMFGVTTRSLKT